MSLTASFPGPFQPGNEVSEPDIWELGAWNIEDAIKIQSLIFAREYRMLISDHFSKDAANTPDIDWGRVVL